MNKKKIDTRVPEGSGSRVLVKVVFYDIDIGYDVSGSRVFNEEGFGICTFFFV